MSFVINSILKILITLLVLNINISLASINIDSPPSLNLVDIDGNSQQLDSWQGKTIVVNFWATYCMPCKQEIRDLIKYQQQYEDKGLQVIGVGVNEAQSIKTMSLLLGVNYPMLLADIEKPGNEDILEKWGNTRNVIPYTVVINPEGKVVYRHRGILKTPLFEKNILPLLD